MPHEPIMISMGDGDCPATVFTADDGAGRDPGAPGVLFYMDAGGVRPPLRWLSSSRMPATSSSCRISFTDTAPTAR